VGFLLRVSNYCMNRQQGLAFDDPDSRTRSGVLNVVRAQAESVTPFNRSLFEGFSRALSDIPDWILDDTGSSSGQIALRRQLLEDFLGRSVKAPSRWLRFLS
jgi:hypothetical protein